MKLSLSNHPLTTGAKALLTPSWIVGASRQVLKTVRGMKNPPEDSFDHGNNAATVLLTPGWSVNPRVMDTIGDQMKERFNVAYAPDFGALNMGDIRESAQLLREKIQTVLEEERNGDLIILGHSSGGLIILETMRGTRYDLRKVITCATAFRGTPQARLGKLFSQACKQLSPDSTYLKSLDKIDLTHVSLDAHISTRDSVVPPESQEPHGLDLGHVRTFEHRFQHFDFIVGKKSQQFARELTQEL